MSLRDFEMYYFVAEGIQRSMRVLTLELAPLHGGAANMQPQGPRPAPLFPQLGISEPASLAVIFMAMSDHSERKRVHKAETRRNQASIQVRTP